MEDMIRLLGDLMARGGIWSVVVVVVLTSILLRPGQAWQAVERMLCRFIPSYEERIRVRDEARKRIRENGIKARVDTALVMQSVITDARTRLDSMEARTDRRDTELYEIIRQNQRLETGVIEALRDISEQMRSQTNILNRMTSK